MNWKWGKTVKIYNKKQSREKPNQWHQTCKAIFFAVMMMIAPSVYRPTFKICKEGGKLLVQSRIRKGFPVEFETYFSLTSDIFHGIWALCSFHKIHPASKEQGRLWLLGQDCHHCISQNLFELCYDLFLQGQSSWQSDWPESKQCEVCLSHPSSVQRS